MNKEMIFLLLGMGAGAVIAFVGGYVLARGKAERKEAMYQVEVDELLQANEEMEQELRPLKKKFKELEATLNRENIEKAALLERIKHVGDVRRELEHEKSLNRQLNERIAELEALIAKLEAQMAVEAESVEKQLELIMETKREIMKEVRALTKQSMQNRD
ncbi:hypothetical protein NNO_2054 [Hydrogenimonas sp.]|nr:hypothetical protein NNO_2054 [Hydrogenimonas sp.]